MSKETKDFTHGIRHCEEDSTDLGCMKGMCNETKKNTKKNEKSLAAIFIFSSNRIIFYYF